jgi:hypothetical protein
MKKMFRLMALAIVVMAFAACGNSNSPEGTVEKFLKSYQKGDYAAVVEQMHFTKEMSEQDKAQLVELFAAKDAPEVEKRGGIASYELGEVEMAEDGQSANVKYILHYGDGSQKEDAQKVILVDGKWVLDSGK